MPRDTANPTAITLAPTAVEVTHMWGTQVGPQREDEGFGIPEEATVQTNFSLSHMQAAGHWHTWEREQMLLDSRGHGTRTRPVQTNSQKEKKPEPWQHLLPLYIHDQVSLLLSVLAKHL